PVVVHEVLAPALRLGPEREVGQGPKLRLARPAGRPPRGPDALEGLAGELGAAAAGGPPRAPAHGAPDRGLGAAADQQLDAVAVDRPRADGLRAAGHRLAAPGAVQEVQRLVPAPAPRAERQAGDLEVVRAAAHADAEDQAAAGELVDAGRLLREQDRAAR